jgi:hypothetical protein
MAFKCKPDKSRAVDFRTRSGNRWQQLSLAEGAAMPLVRLRMDAVMEKRIANILYRMIGLIGLIGLVSA